MTWTPNHFLSRHRLVGATGAEHGTAGGFAHRHAVLVDDAVGAALVAEGVTHLAEKFDTPMAGGWLDQLDLADFGGFGVS